MSMIILYQTMKRKNKSERSSSFWCVDQGTSEEFGSVVNFLLTFKIFPSIMHLLAHLNGFFPKALGSTCMGLFFWYPIKCYISFIKPILLFYSFVKYPNKWTHGQSYRWSRGWFGKSIHKGIFNTNKDVWILPLNLSRSAKQEENAYFTHERLTLEGDQD